MSKVKTTPKGKAVYPRIDTPDTKFNPEGMYSCKLHVSEEDFNSFSKEVSEIVEKAYKEECQIKGKKLRKASSSPLRITPEGDFEIYAKQVARRETRKGLLEFTVPAYDSQGKRIPETPNIGSGSILRMSVEVYSWYTDVQGFGYTLRLKAVQVLELVEYNSLSNPFGVVEGGYVQNESLDSAFTDEDAPSF